MTFDRCMFGHWTDCQREYLGFDDRLLMLIGLPLLAFNVTILIHPDHFREASLSHFVFVHFSIGLLYTMAMWLSFRACIIALRKRYPEHREWRKRLMMQGLALPIVYLLVSKVLKLVICIFTGPDYDVLHADPLVATLAGVLTCVMITSVYEAAYFSTMLSRSLLQQEQLHKANLQSQLDGLKSQVNPHFLFNSLNTLLYLIPQSPKQAMGFVEKLAQVYRYILEIRDLELISLEDELKFLNAYFYLLRERFGDSLQIDIQIPDEYLQQQLVPLSLQMLLENVIKHNTISRQHPLTIELYVERASNSLVMRNTLKRKNQIQTSTRVGLKNIKKRYAFFTDQTVDVLQNDTHFSVSLPILAVQHG